jgi:hypothetical protein
MGNALKEDITGRYVVIKEEALQASYRDIKYRVFKAEGGFGCSPFTAGQAVLGYTPFDREKFRIEGHDIERYATDEEIRLVSGQLDNVDDETEVS